MTNPTRQDIINAYEELDKLCARVPGTSYSKMIIAAALPPHPQPSMAEVEWDDDKHYLAEAHHDIWGDGIMLFQNPDTHNIFTQFYEGDERNLIYCPPEYLTLTGRTFELTEKNYD